METPCVIDVIQNKASEILVTEVFFVSMLSGLKYSRKKFNTLAQERFSVENMAYTQMFIDYLHAKDPFKLKFFDECGLKLPFHGKRLYGHAPVGERCIELLRYHDSPNITVNLLAGLNGVEYMNTVQGASDTSLRAGSLVWGRCATILAAKAAICESASEASRQEEWGGSHSSRSPTRKWRLSPPR